MSTAPNRAASKPGAERRLGLLLPGLLTLVGLAVLISLGNWQLRRLAWKDDLIARATERPRGEVLALPSPSQWPALDIAEAEYRPYRLSGRFLHEEEAWVFTSLPDPAGRYGGPGYWIVTPFALDLGGTVLVNRGFAPHGRHAAAERDEPPPADGSVTVTGLLRPSEAPGPFTPENRPAENLFFARDVEAIADAKDLPPPVAPFTIDLVAAETPPGGLPQAGETRFRFSNNHLQYAITWYGLAAALVVVFAAVARARFGARA
jgi:surfeit locus 1 family protein